MNIVKEINRLNRPDITDPEHDVTAREVIRAISSLLAEIILADDGECDDLSEWEDGIRELGCAITNGHEWTHDHCGHWGHMYCVWCHAPKYPDLVGLRCSEGRAKTGDITEEEYVRRLRNPNENKCK